MSLTLKDVEKFSKSYKCFSKLLILYPMIHPATMHGLLEEFNYDYGFVMQLILKLESQRNALYWDEVARVSKIMEQENLARMNLYSDPNYANHRHSQMMAHEMFNVANSYGESSSFMDVPEQRMDETSYDPNLDSPVVRLLENSNFSPAEYNLGLQLNQFMQKPGFEITEQRAVRSGVDGMAENNTSLSMDEMMSIAEQQVTYSDPHIAGFIENQANPASSSINWQLSGTEKKAKARSLQTYSNPNIIEPRVTELVRNLRPAHNHNSKIRELMEAAKSQMAQYYATSNNSNFRVAEMAGNQLSQMQYLHSTPNCQSDDTEQALNLQTTPMQQYSNNSNFRHMNNQTHRSSSPPIVHWETSGIREEAQNLQTTESELHLYNPDWHLVEDIKNDGNQVIYIDPVSLKNLQDNENQTPERTQTHLMNIVESMDNQEIQRNYTNQTHHKSALQNKKMQSGNHDVKTVGLFEKPINRMNLKNPAINNNNNWQFFELKEFSNIQTAQSQYQNSSSGDSTIFEISEIVEIPLAESTNQLNSTSELDMPHPALNNTNWQLSSGIIMEPKIQMTLLHSEPLLHVSNENTEALMNPINTTLTKRVSNRRVNEQKLKIKELTLRANVPKPEVCKTMEMLKRKPVKRRSNDNDSEVPVKRSRKDQTIKPNSRSKTVELGKSASKVSLTHKTSKLNDMMNKQQNYQPIQLESSKNKGKPKPQTRSCIKKTDSKRKEKQKVIKTKSMSINVDAQNNKSKKKTMYQLNKKLVEKRNALENQKREASKSKSERNKNKAQARRTARRTNLGMFAPSLDFFNDDPHVTKIEKIPQGQLITVRPKLYLDDSRSEVQFIRRFHPNFRQATQNGPKSKKAKPQNIKKQKKTGAEPSKKSDSKMCRTTEKSPNQKKSRSKRQTEISSTVTSSRSQNSSAAQKKQMYKSTNGCSGTNSGTGSRKQRNPKFPTGKGSGSKQKVAKGSVLCCCQSIVFRKKYKLPPFDKDDWVPDEILFPTEECLPEEDETNGPAREADQNVSGDNAEKNKKTSVSRSYNTRSKKEKE